MSRAQEIREKQELQTKLALAFNKKRQTVLSWLPNEEQKDDKTVEKSRSEFMKLPVVANGSIFNLNDHSKFGYQQPTDNKSEIGTIGEFLVSEKKISSLTKKRNNSNRSIVQDSLRAQKNDNKATSAFKNKMRDSQRQQLRKSINTRPDYSRHTKAEDSDSDDDSFKRADVKKKSNSMPVQFGKKKKK